MIQVASELFPAFNIPEFAIRYVWFGVLLVFPLAVFVGWIYQISRQGIRRTLPTVEGDQTDTSLRRADYFVLCGVGLVGLCIAILLAGKILALRGESPEAGIARAMDPNSVAVLPLDNFTGDPGQDFFVAGLHEGRSPPA